MSKIKGCSDAIKLKHLIIVFVVSLLAALPTRTYQLLTLVNTENGFFENGDFTVPLLYGLVGVSTLFFLVFSFLCKGIPKPKFNTGKNPVLALAALFMAAGFIWDIISIERKIVPQLNGYVSTDVFNNLFTVYLKENGGAFLVLEFVFAVLGVFWALIFAASYFEGKEYHKKFPILALSPLCWCMSVLVSKLMEPISFITVSELLFEIFMMVFAMLFFITFARICTGVFTENSMWGIFAYGFATALFSGLVTIPRLVIYFSGLEPVKGNEFSLSHLAIFVFVIVAVLAARGIGFKHGLEHIQSVSELELPDDEDVVVKEAKLVSVTEIIDDEFSGVEAVFSMQDDSDMDDALDEYMREMEQENSANDVTEEPVVEIAEEVTEEPVVEIAEEVTEEPVVEIAEEVTEEPVAEIVEEVTEEPVVEIAEEVAEKPEEDFVEFSEMLIDDVEDINTIVEGLKKEKKYPKKAYPAKKTSKKEDRKTTEKEKVKKPKKAKDKSTEDSDESIKITSLADLKKENNSR